MDFQTIFNAVVFLIIMIQLYIILIQKAEIAKLETAKCPHCKKGRKSTHTFSLLMRKRKSILSDE